ncbi:MAG: hypothetical protein MI861_21325 [Pirellulales bacterium]|nr:hypothetical protein [Pirellulales bacterium]
MWKWLDHLCKRWQDWCGDREMELAIRKHLNQAGYYGNTAKLENVRLVAAERPGWLQIYCFEATARIAVEAQNDEVPDPAPQYRRLYGLVRDDIRHKINDVRTFESASEQSWLFAQWSEGLICLRGARGLGRKEVMDRKGIKPQ